MTRQDLIKINPTITEEQVSAILAAHHAELQQEKDKNKGLKDTSKELEEAQKEIEALKAKADSGAPDDWQAQIDKLTEANQKAQRQIKNMELKNKLLGKGFGEEDADKFIKTLDEGGDIADVLGSMKENVISAYDKERMAKTPEPTGSPKKGDDSKSTAEKLASSIVSGFKSETQENVLANYM